MNYVINNKNNTNILTCNLQHGEKMKVGINSIIAMEPNLGLTFSEDGNALKNITKMVMGNNMFFQYLIASKGDGKVILASDKPGAIIPLTFDGSFELKVARDAFIAATESIIIESKITLLNGNKNGLQLITLRGKGDVFLGNYGGFLMEQLDRGQELLVNAGCAMAWTSSIKVKSEKSGNGIINSLTGNKAEILRFIGPGHVILQTRSNTQMKYWLRDLGIMNGEDTQALLKKSIDENSKTLKNEFKDSLKTIAKGGQVPNDPLTGQKEYEALTKDAKIALTSKVASLKNITNAEQLKVIQELTTQGYSAEVINYVQEHVTK